MVEFVRVARSGDIDEGELRGLDANGRQLALCRVGGAVYAFDDTCTHRGCSLSQGELDGTEVICPCHAGVFDVRNGEVVDGPPPEPVETYPVRVVGEDIEVEL
jgi:3-phenylpropionate/trans-cinnamate dioxygenase ferredoxin subunit